MRSLEGISFGIDIGGTGMKAAPVDLATGELAGERHRIDTPAHSTPEQLADVVRRLVRHHRWDGPVGICMPSVVTNGVVRTAANIDDSWIGVDAASLFAAAVDAPVALLNDADAAGQAEMAWGVGRGRGGVVVCLTFGTGIGSGLFVDGTLVPNTEFGHLELGGDDAELRAAAKARERESLSWSEWGDRANVYLRHVQSLVWPELIIVGGGVSKRADRWIDRVDVPCDLAVAALANNAGIAGAALHAPG